MTKQEVTKQEAIKRITELKTELAELESIAATPAITPEERFWQLMDGCVMDTQNPDYTLWMKDGTVFFKLINDTLWCSRRNVWSVFKNEYSMKFDSIQSLIKTNVENRLKMNGITPKEPHRNSIFEVENR